MIYEALTPQQIAALVLIYRADGTAVRSNYTAEERGPDGQWQIYWRTLDTLICRQLVMQVGSRHSVTLEGERLLRIASRRRR